MSKIAKMRRDRRSGRKGTVCCRFFVVPVAPQSRILGTLLFLSFPQARRNPVQNAKKIVVVGFSPHLARPGQNGKFSVLGFRCAWRNPMQSAREMAASGFSFLLVRPSAKSKDCLALRNMGDIPTTGGDAPLGQPRGQKKVPIANVPSAPAINVPKPTHHRSISADQGRHAQEGA